MFLYSCVLARNGVSKLGICDVSACSHKNTKVSDGDRQSKGRLAIAGSAIAMQ
jgi:hypothetical protein